MRRRATWSVFLLLVSIAAADVAAYEYVGSLFDLGSSARGLGLGGAFTALADDEGCVLHNPAGLGWRDAVGVSSLYVRQFGGVTYGAIAVALPYVGVDVMLLDSGLIPTSGGTTRYSSQGFVAAGGVALGPVGIGARWRLLRVSAPGPGSGWSLDPALQFVTSIVRAGAILEGALSSAMAYESGSQEAWERSLRLGVALTLEPGPDVAWNAAFEASGLFSSSPVLSAGLEAWIGGMGARVGFDGEALTYGLSVRFAGLQLDWAYASRTDLGESHRVSFSFRF